jgi:hypothetical protein
MKRIGILIFGLLLTCQLIAQTSAVPAPRIKATYSISEDGDTTSFTEYFYDSQKRCTKVVDHDSYFGYIETIAYPSATSVVSNRIFSRDNKTINTTYTLNTKGQAIAYMQIEKKDTIRERIVYTATGFSMELGDIGWQNASDAELKEGNFNINSRLIISNGNIRKDGRDHTFTYYTDKKNTIGKKNFGIGYLGNDNKNPVKEQTVPVMDTYVKYTFTYLYDAKGKIIKQKDSPGDLITYYAYVD